MWNQKRVHDLFWDAVIPTNEGVPVADSDFIVAWALYCLYQPYWVCGCKGYFVHKAHIPTAVELKESCMAMFGVPSFPQSRASPWQIMILWQFGPQTVCTSHIRSVGPRVFCSYSSYTRLTVESKSRIWPSLGCCRSQGLFGTYHSNIQILSNKEYECGQIWLTLFQ